VFLGKLLSKYEQIFGHLVQDSIFTGNFTGPQKNSKHMKIKALLFLFTISLLYQSLHAQDIPEPRLESIIHHYFENYDPPVPAERYLSFERRPEGYYVVATDQYQNIQGTELLYDFNKAAYEEVSIYNLRDTEYIDANPSAHRTPKEKADYYINVKRNFINQFDIQPFYGYDGWYNDVIDFYQTQHDLNDWQLHAFARAYRTKAGNLFHDYDGYAVKSEMFDLPLGRGHMTEEQISYFLDLYQKCLDVYKKLLKRNPSYKTPVGTISTKYSQEIMDRFLMLLTHQDEETARSTLNDQDTLFDEFTLKLCRNLLNSCPADAVLITWGDGDTFPLYYLQVVENYRTDVVIVNASLINIPRYLELIYDAPFNAKTLERGYSDRYIEDVSIMASPAYALPTSKSITFPDLLELLKVESNYTNMQNYPYDIINVPKKILLPVPKDVEGLNNERIDTVEINVPRYTAIDQTLAWDILWSNQWKRPICYSIACQSRVWASLKTHLALEGIVYRVYPTNLPPVDYASKGPVNLERSYELWMNQFQWEKDTKPYAGNALHYIHIQAGIAVVKELIAQKETDKALAMIEQMRQQMPDSIVPWEYHWLEIVDAAFQLRNEELGEEMATQIVQNYIDGKAVDPYGDFRNAVKEQLIILSNKYSNITLMQMIHSL
jgi:hypothetical protein